MSDLARFKQEIADAQRDMEKELRTGDPDLWSVMIWRDAIEIGTLQLKEHPEIALGFRNQRAAGGTAEDRWWKWIISQAIAFRDPEKSQPDVYRRTASSYQSRADEIFRNADYLVEVGFKIEGKYWDVYQRVNPIVRDIGAQIAHALRTYPSRHKYDDAFLQWSVDESLQRMLQMERPDLDAALRLANELPRDEHVGWLHPAPAAPASGDDDSIYKDAVEFVVSCIPFVGNAVMTYEVISGSDLFGRDLSFSQRGLLAAGILLPMASRFVEESNAIYSAGRLSRLYGGDAREWEQSLALSEKISAEDGSFRTLTAARDAIESGKSIPAQLRAQVEGLLKKIEIDKAADGLTAKLSADAEEAFDLLVIKSDRWGELDANAVARIMRKKLSSAVKGQLFEEVLANRIALWLADPAGKAALGLADVSARLEFIPGYLITSLSGRQLTDGLLVQRMGKNRYAIWAVFEAKSGTESAAGLSRTRVSLDKTKAGRAELIDEAEDAMKVLQERARRSGTPVTMTLDDIKKEISQETGGQIARDIERLYGNATDTLKAAPQKIFIGGEEVEVVISPRNKTKFFGVAPTGVDLSTVATELRGQGVKNFVALSLNCTEKELNEAADVIKSALGLKK